MSKKIVIGLGVVIVLLIAGFYGAVKYSQNMPAAPTEQISSSPSASPNQSSISFSETFRDDKQGIAFRYPRAESLGQFIHTYVWPPVITTNSATFTCREEKGQGGGLPTTLRKTVSGHEYCIRALSEGAAGTTYVQYAYSILKDGKLVTLNFTLKYPQCGNYPDPEKSTCEHERVAFNLDDLVDRIVQTLTMKEA